MISWLKRLLWDESAFSRYARLFLNSGGAGLMAAATSWQLPEACYAVATRQTWMLIAAAMLGLGGLIGAGDKNLTLPELRTEERKAVSDAANEAEITRDKQKNGTL